MTVYNGTRKGLNVTVVGNPTINGTVVSGFSKTNYVRTPEPLPTINYLNRFAVQLSVVFTKPSTITEVISGDETTFLLRANKNKLCLFASSNGTSWDIADQVYGTYTLQAGVKYFITVQLEDGVVSVLIRAEGEPAPTRDISITFTTKKPDLSGKYIYFGWFNRTYFPGLTVDLQNCYYQIRYTTRWRAYDDMPRKIEDIYYSGPKKYWKEITTSTEVEKEVLGYACYRQDKYRTPNIYYVKPPLGEDTVMYAYGYDFNYAPDYDSVTPLIAQGETEPAHFISVTEDTLNITGINARSVDSLVRQKDHDIYHMATVTETTTEIVEGTKEDHTYSEPDVKQILSIHKPTGNTVGTKPEYALLYNKKISLLKAKDFNSIKESSSGVAIWGDDATSTGSQHGGIQNLKQQDSITFNKSLPAGKYTVVFNYYSQVNFTMRLVQFTATYEDGTTEVVYSNTSLGDTAYGGGEKADVTTTMTFNKRIKGITTLAQGSGGGNGCYGGFGKIRMSLSGTQQ